MNLKINNKNIGFRKWKVKDRNAFINATNDIERRQALVYNCLDNPNTPLDMEEYNYVLLKIRSESLSPIINYSLKCPKCGKLFNTSIDLNEFLSVEPKNELQPIIVENISIELQDIRNKDYYENAITSTNDRYQKYLIDFALHIKSINNNSALTFESVMEFINDLDVDIFEKIFNQWGSQRFKIDMTGYIECPHCLENTLYNFDDLPNFFPLSWKI